jgi:hypothetical protein
VRGKSGVDRRESIAVLDQVPVDPPRAEPVDTGGYLLGHSRTTAHWSTTIAGYCHNGNSHGHPHTVLARCRR